MNRAIDLLYRIGVGALVCSSLYRLFVKILPPLLAAYALADRGNVVMVGICIVVLTGPLLSLWLADRLLRSVTTETDDDAAET